MTKDEDDSYNKDTICHICLKEFDNDKDKVRDYCYFTGRYRGAAHNDCNLRHKIPKNIPIVFHNGSMYDYHFLIKELAEEFDGNFEFLERIWKNTLPSQSLLRKESKAKIWALPID